MSSTDKKTEKRMISGIVAIILLSLCLCVTTYALVLATVSSENQFFQTGTVKINLNDGKPVIEEHEFLFEPGMTVKKDFFIENKGTGEVYYKLYLGNLTGGLADVLEITICDGEKVLYQETAANLTGENTKAADDLLGVGERRVLTVYFHFPEEAGNSAQNLTLSFDLCADAVQTKNNPDKLFA